MQNFDTHSIDNIQVKLDIGLIESNLNTTLNKITTAIKYLLSKVQHYEHTNILNTEVHSLHLEKIQQTQQQYKNNQESIYNELFVNDGQQNKKISRINAIENQIIKIKDVIIKDQNRPLSRLQSKKSIMINEGENRSNIRIRDRASNTRQASRQMKKVSRMQSRKRINNDIEQGYKQQSKSLHGSFINRIGSQKNTIFEDDRNHTINYCEQKDQNGVPIIRSFKNSNQLDGQSSNFQRNYQNQLELLIKQKLKQIETNYQSRFQQLQKHCKIKNKPKGICFQQIQKSKSSNKSLQSGSNVQQQSQQIQQNQEIENILANKIEQIKCQIGEINNKLKKQQIDQKQLSKRSNDILIKFEKNHERVTAALRYLEKNITNIYDKLKQADIIGQQDTLLDGNDKKKQQRKNSRISKMCGIGETILPDENIVNKIQTMTHLIKNMEEQVQEMKLFMGIGKFENSGFLPRISGDKDNSGRLKNFMIGNSSQQTNLKLIEIQSTMDKMKVKIKTLTDITNQFPLKLLQLGTKIRQQGQIRQQRFVELIKQLIDRALLDPFNNHFTNHLRKQIYVKFLQIKHQYSGILKQIQKKVQDRADKKEIQYINQKYETTLLQLKSIISKKTDADDSKKWNKFMESKMKQLFDMIKTSEGNQFKLIQQHTLSIKKKS